MKYTIILFTLIFAFSSLNAQDKSNESNSDTESLGLAGDNLDLYAVLDLFQKSKTIEDFEADLNDEKTGINNLDLNLDEKVDFIKVATKQDKNDFIFVLQIDMAKDDIQDVAVIYVSKNEKEEVSLLMEGDESLYGKDYIIEPLTEQPSVTPNPAYGGTDTVVVEKQTIVVVESTPIVHYVYSPVYVPYYPPYYYGYYPPYYRPYPVVTFHFYYGRHHHHHNHYHGGHHGHRGGNTVIINNNTNNYNRNSSRTVNNNKKNGSYNGNRAPKGNSPKAKPSTRPSNKPSTRPSTKPSNKASTRPNQSSKQKPSTSPSKSPSKKPSTKPSQSSKQKPSTKPSQSSKQKYSTRPSQTPKKQSSTRATQKPKQQSKAKPAQRSTPNRSGGAKRR